jgi:hypothetical protein
MRLNLLTSENPVGSGGHRQPGVEGEAGSRWPPCRCRPRTAAAGGHPQAGLEFVEKLFTKLTSTDTTERNAMVRASRSVASAEPATGSS